MSSVRESLLAAITAAVPAGTHVIPYQDNMDLPDRITVMFKQLRITPLPEAPRAGYVVHYVLTVVSPALDPSVAEADLDVFVPSMLGDLDALDWFAWDEATKVLSQGLMAYDITCWNLGYKVTPTPAPPTTTRKRKGQ
jgi:hypothetical protein